MTKYRSYFINLKLTQKNMKIFNKFWHVFKESSQVLVCTADLQLREQQDCLHCYFKVIVKGVRIWEIFFGWT